VDLNNNGIVLRYNLSMSRIVKATSQNNIILIKFFFFFK
jgi:hypothetical protein